MNRLFDPDLSGKGIEMKKIFLSALILSVCFSLSGCGNSKIRQETEEAVLSYNEAAKEANTAVAAYNYAVYVLSFQKEELDAAIQNAEDTAHSGGIPFDEQTLSSLNEEIQTAYASEPVLPDQFIAGYEELSEPGRNVDKSDLDEQREKAQGLLDDLKANPVPDPPAIPDYSEEIARLESAASAYEDSVAGYELVLSASEDYVIERLQSIDTITDIEAEPAKEKENSQREESPVCVYFTDSRVDRYALYIRDEDPGAAETGVKGGGCVEIYDSEEQAQRRQEELASYDGTIFGGGAHRSLGVMVLCVSNLLPNEEQLQLLDALTDALLTP